MASAVQARSIGLSKDESGSVAMMFGLSFMAFLFCAGMGIDMARMSNASTRVAAAADAAALAAGRALLEGKLEDSAVEDLGEKMFWSDYTSSRSFANVSSAKVNVDRSTGTVVVDVKADVKMTITALAGFKKFDIPVHNAATFQTKDIEVGMALDITGSMNDVPSGGGKSKIESLKDAFEKFADQLMPAKPVAGQKVRVGLAPYSAAVNLGKYASTVSDSRSTDGCVIERLGANKWTDMPTTAGAYSVKADAKTNKGSYVCPSAKVMPLTDDRDALVAKVKAYSANGGTAGHLGVQWGWNLVSENWGSTWGAAGEPESYQKVTDGKLIKAVVMMTDGSFNTAYNNGTSPDQAKQVCDNMKAKGIKVFAIAFDAPADSQALLKYCASSATDYYADAANDTELKAAFAKFASKLGELHLSK